MNFKYLAVGNPSAVDDILNNPRFQGAIESISWLTKICDGAFSAFISFVAFFIMSSAVGRNVVAGAYAAWPKLFDRVAEVKQDLITLADQKVAANYSPVVKFFIGFIPDFKSISEFQDDTITPRDYFIKAIPQGFAVLMIGVVIYNGYYRDVMAKAANFGSTLITRALVSIDPIQVFDNIVAATGDPGFASDNDKTDKGKYTVKISKDCYASAISFYNDITGDKAKTSLANSIESWVREEVLTSNSKYLNMKQWKLQYQVDRVYNGVASNNKTTDDGSDPLYHNVEFMKPFADFKIQSNKHPEESWSLRLILSFKKIAQGVTTNTETAKAVISFSNMATSISSGGDVTVNLSSITAVGGRSSITLSGQPVINYDGKSYPIVAGVNSLTIQGFGQAFKTAGTAVIKILDVKALYYGSGASNDVGIGEIDFNNGTAKSTVSDTTGQFNTVDFGNALTPKTP